MSVSKRVRETLEESNIPFQICEHKLAYTAQEVAAVQHVPGKELAKTVILKVEDRYVMAVLPASYHVDLERFQWASGAEGVAEVRLAHEEEFTAIFPDSEPGAMAPFGNLYDMPVYVDQTLEEDDEIVFNAGSHRETIRMSYPDYRKSAHPIVSDFAVPG